MKTLRRLSYAAFAVAYTHLVFGAIVRISGSGLGCGENWPKCYGHWFPPVDRPDLIIEWTHRLIASILITTVALLAAVTWRKRHEPGVSGRGGVLRPALAAVGVVLFAAVLGAVTVFLGNAWYATAAHWTVAMTLIAVLAVTGIRAGGFGGGRGTRDASRVVREEGVAPASAARTGRLATLAASLAFLTVILGGLTAKVPGGSVACRDFPLCGMNPAVDTQAVVIQGTHRVLAFTVLFYLIAMAFAVRARGNERRVVIAGRTALGFAVLQILVAGAMIGMHLPAVLRSLHEAVGVAVWVSTFVFAYLAARVARVEGRESSLVMEPAGDRDEIRIPAPSPAGASASALIEIGAEAEVVEPWMAPAVELIPEPAVDAAAIAEPAPSVEPEPAATTGQEAAAEPVAAVEPPSVPEAPSATTSGAPLVVMPEDPERAARPASRAPTMAVIVARGADIL